MLYYPNTKVFDVIGTVAAPVTLAATYTNSKVLPISGKSEMVFDVSYITGASETGTTLNIQLFDSPDNVKFYQLTNEAASSGTSTLTARTFAFAGGAGATTYKFSYRLDVSYKFMKVQVEEAGVVTNFGTVYIGTQLAGN